MAEIEVEETFETTTVRKKTVKRSIKIEEVSRKCADTNTHKHSHKDTQTHTHTESPFKSLTKNYRISFQIIYVH